jgi:hypothetical protein
MDYRIQIVGRRAHITQKGFADQKYTLESINGATQGTDNPQRLRVLQCARAMLNKRKVKPSSLRVRIKKLRFRY